MKRFFLVIFVLLMVFAITYTQSHNKSQKEPLSVGSVIKDAPYNIETVYIPAGTLKWEADYERHAMVVSLESFYIGKVEVTQKQWKSVMGNNPSEFIGDNLPVANVNWPDAREFLKKLSEKTGYKYRLPTEAEWEYACRAGSTTDYYFGNDTSLLGEHEWYYGNANGKPHPVGLKKSNPWGVHDMGGNVAEWTSTIWDPEPFNERNPDRKLTGGTRRIYRGGHINHPRLVSSSSSYQHSILQERRAPVLGFRCVREK